MIEVCTDLCNGSVTKLKLLTTNATAIQLKYKSQQNKIEQNCNFLDHYFFEWNLKPLCPDLFNTGLLSNINNLWSWERIHRLSLTSNALLLDKTSNEVIVSNYLSYNNRPK